MNDLRNHRRVSILFYLLTGYVLLQFAWWAYLLIDLSIQHYADAGPDTVRIKIWMIAGEGAVFLIFLLAGIYIMRRTITREIGLAKQQRNFLLSITHELKTPLAGIKLALQTLQKRSTLDADKRSEIEKGAIANTERLHNLIDNVLLAARLESGVARPELTQTNLAELTRDIVRTVSLHAAREQEIHTDIPTEIRGRFDVNAYTSILTNLLENALKYGDGQPVEISLASDEERITLIVADRGPGIPDNDFRRIFEMFYRPGNEDTRSKKGTGLGLFIVKELTESLGGTIRVEKREPTGTEFTIFLPRRR